MCVWHQVTLIMKIRKIKRTLNNRRKTNDLDHSLQWKILRCALAGLFWIESSHKCLEWENFYWENSKTNHFKSSSIINRNRSTPSMRDHMKYILLRRYIIFDQIFLPLLSHQMSFKEQNHSTHEQIIQRILHVVRSVNKFYPLLMKT